MVRKKSWKEFQGTGLLWFINTTLHAFGWAIVVQVNDDGSMSEAFPARVGFRGFSSESTSKGYIKLSQYMKDNSEELYTETIE